MNYKRRIGNVQKLLQKMHVDALFITDFYSLLYLTGFKTLSPHEMEAKGILTKDHVFIITDSRYESEATEYFENNDVASVSIQKIEHPMKEIISDIISNNSVTKLGFESQQLTYQWYEYVGKILQNSTLVPLLSPFSTMRNVKDEDELQLMRKASSLTDECLSDISKRIRVGTTERELYRAIEAWTRDHDLTFSFDPIVAVDSHAALPHYNNQVNNGTIEQGSIVLIDMGLTYQDYTSDITRMFFVGNSSDEQQKAYEDLLSIQERTIQAIHVDVKMSLIDKVARQGLIDLGYPSIPHSTGHGLGLEVHEELRVSKGVDETVADGMVFTIEPGIYFPEKWGMRIEDTVAIVDGKVEILTQFPKDLTVR